MVTCVVPYTPPSCHPCTESAQNDTSTTSTTKPATPRHINQLHRRLSRYPSTTLSDLIPAATAALKASNELKQAEDEPPTVTTTFARALTKVRMQVQTKRLKEKYLSHEWIRLALGLPVDESIINNTKYPSPPMKKKTKSNSIRMVALKSLEGRTGEIATWYEWKFDKSKFTVEEIESKVDRLRQRTQERKLVDKV
ncbi:hypothetical protein BJV82DRAFT_190066 [Fennellomyces sp. T-0311]|nr:hypothetical protein BJV82DRAFT_190066 [Fennellomyces sp. T-0311]